MIDAKNIRKEAEIREIKMNDSLNDHFYIFCQHRGNNI
jgi:hypothetical protein